MVSRTSREKLLSRFALCCDQWCRVENVRGQLDFICVVERSKIEAWPFEQCTSSKEILVLS